MADKVPFLIGPNILRGVSRARKIVQWTIFSGERVARGDAGGGGRKAPLGAQSQISPSSLPGCAAWESTPIT